VFQNTRLTYTATVKLGDEPSQAQYTYTAEGIYDYDPYGKILRSFTRTKAGEKYLTTGHERDTETDLDYRGARFYDSEVVRFLSLDPLAAKYSSWSAYNYVLGNPVRLVDKDGQAPTDIIYVGKDGAQIRLTSTNTEGVDPRLNSALTTMASNTLGEKRFNEYLNSKTNDIYMKMNDENEIGGDLGLTLAITTSSVTYDKQGKIDFSESFGERDKGMVKTFNGVDVSSSISAGKSVNLIGFNATAFDQKSDETTYHEMTLHVYFSRNSPIKFSTAQYITPNAVSQLTNETFEHILGGVGSDGGRVKDNSTDDANSRKNLLNKMRKESPHYKQNIDAFETFIEQNSMDAYMNQRNN
jgi:RHS repeat-associated protein